MHKWAKYLTDRIGKKDSNNQKVLKDFFEKYGYKEKKSSNSNDPGDSIQLSDLL